MFKTPNFYGHILQSEEVPLKDLARITNPTFGAGEMGNLRIPSIGLATLC